MCRIYSSRPWLHRHIIGLLPEPRWSAHTSGARLSRALLKAVADFATRAKQLQYVEAMFATLGKHRKLNLEYDPVMKLSCCLTDPSYERLVGNIIQGDRIVWWHPFKNISAHPEFRQRLREDGYL